MSEMDTPHTLNKTVKSMIFQLFAAESDVFSLGATFFVKK